MSGAVQGSGTGGCVRAVTPGGGLVRPVTRCPQAGDPGSSSARLALGRTPEAPPKLQAEMGGLSFPPGPRGWPGPPRNGVWPSTGHPLAWSGGRGKSTTIRSLSWCRYSLHCCPGGSQAARRSRVDEVKTGAPRLCCSASLASSGVCPSRGPEAMFPGTRSPRSRSFLMVLVLLEKLLRN